MPSQPEMSQRTSLSAPSRRARDTSPDPHQASALPAWVHVTHTDTPPLLSPPRLPSQPPRAVPNTRHYRPPAPSKRPVRPGRKWDHLRSRSPPLLSLPIPEHQERWRPFMSGGPQPEYEAGNAYYDREDDGGARVVDQAWMDEHMGFLGQGWTEEDEAAVEGKLVPGGRGLMYRGKWLVSPERQEKSVRLFWRLLLKNPFIPLALRLTVLCFSLASLAVAAQIFTRVKYVNSDPDPSNQCAPRASTYMAIIVGVIAIPYSGYVTWDEYMSKPLGLRSSTSKTLLLLCDLYFIVFSASNVSLAFDALFDHRWACYDERFAVVGDSTLNVPATCPDNKSICSKQKALSGVLVVGVAAWLMTFSISVLRVVEKLRVE